jgi:hypothetical protein
MLFAKHAYVSDNSGILINFGFAANLKLNFPKAP